MIHLFSLLFIQATITLRMDPIFTRVIELKINLNIKIFIYCNAINFEKDIYAVFVMILKKQN